MERTRPGWANDTGLYWHLRTAVTELVKGRGTYDQRMKTAMGHLTILTPATFPADLRHHFDVVLRARDRAVWQGEVSVLIRYRRLSPKERDAFSEALIALFEAIVMDRAITVRRGEADA